MDKKISIILVAMLCLSMFPWASIGVGSEAKNVENAETLKVDAWVESKLAKPGDTIEIYAKTSYTEGVSVSANIMKYEHNEGVIESLSLDNLDLSGIIYTVYVTTISLTYDATEKHWVGIYTIPSSAGGVYVADVTATDGVNTANDNATVHLQKFYDEWIKPVQDNAETFLYGEFNDTIYYIKDQIENFRDVINNSGGIRGIVENLTKLPEWQALLDASYDPIYDDYEHYYSEYFWEYFSANASFEYYITVPDWVDILEVVGYCGGGNYSYDGEIEVNVTVALTDPDGNVYTYDLNEYEPYMISSPTPGNWIINVATSGNGYFSLSVDGYLSERSKIACFLDNLTKFILSDEYESIKSMIPELKSFILGIPTEPDIMIDYLLGFNLTQYLNKIEGAEGIVAAYNALMDSDKCASFQNALDALQASETQWNQQNLSIAIMDLFMSDEMMNLLNATLAYLQGNDTALQNLINSFIALGGDFSQLGNLMDLPEFKELINASKNDPNLGPVYESVNTTFNNIKNRVETMVNSTQLQNLKTSIENLQAYAESDVLYEYECFSEDETFNYTYTVKDWVKELYLDLDPYFDGYYDYYDYENGTYIPGIGNITVTLTDPEGFVHTYTESYNGSGYYYNYYDGIHIEEKYKPGYAGYEIHDYTILFPISGNWTINVATSSDSGDGGHYNLEIGSTEDFMAYMLKESMEEIFFVFNAGIVIETDYFQAINSTGSAKLIAYDANGKIANEEINVVVSRNTGGMLGASSIIPAAILYVWVSGFMATSEADGSANDTYYDEEYETEEASSPFDALPYIKKMMEEIKPGIVYEGKVTTDLNGEVTINFPVEKFGIYSIDAYFENENKIGFGESAFIGESFVPEIGLTQIGKFAGVPVYMNPNKIGENITFNVNIPDGENASVGIAPMPLNELFPDINMSYESSDTTITGPDSVSLQVNGPVSLIGVITEMPVGEAEYEEYNEGYTSYPDTSFSIPQFNISFGILLTSNVSVSLDVPNILKGERAQIDVSATGTPVITYGLGYYANGLDIMSLDVTTLSTMIYESAVYQKEQNITDVMEQMKSMICGPGNTAFVTIPKLAVDGGYSFITFTNVNNTDIGAAFISVNVYAGAKEIPAVISNKTVDNKDVVVTYVGSGKVTIKKVTVTPQAPPANMKHIGIFIEIDTTGTVHDAFITIKYNDSDVVDIDESKLKMYYWNETTSEWTLIEDSGVWTNNNTVWARITHFTIFAPMAEKTAAGPAPGIGWLIYVGVFSAVIIIVVISLAVTVKRKKKTLPPSP